MTAKEYHRAMVASRGDASHKYGFHQSAFINYMEKGGYFFCIYFFSTKAELTVKPMYVDDLWWEIWHTPKNTNRSKSLRGRGVYSISGQILTTYSLPTPSNCKSFTDISSKVDSIISRAMDEIDKFLLDNPIAINFYPDESKMQNDPDRLLLLMALVRNMRYDEALDIIERAKRDGHKCQFKNGRFIDSYKYIKYYCSDRTLLPKILNIIYRPKFFYNSAAQTYKNANAFLNQNPFYNVPWYKRIPDWLITFIIVAIYFASAFAQGAPGYRTLYLTPKWVLITGGMIFALIPLVLIAIWARDSFKEPGTFCIYLLICIISGTLGYGLTAMGTAWFYAINYWFREPQQITTKAIVTADRWDYETYERYHGNRVHYVNILELPEEHRKITAVDGYIHTMPTDTEFDLVYTKGFFGIDIFENAINIHYPSENPESER